MREIKFRAWDERKKEYYRGAIAVSNDGVIRMLDDNEYEIWVDTNFIAEQYTGLKDMQGVEIYEGDLVEWEGEIWEVVWFVHGYALADENGRCMLSDNFNVIVDGCILDIEVIGNIHENPELLREDK